MGLTDKCRTNLKNLVINQLIDRSKETLHAVQDIPRMYRKTNREVNIRTLTLHSFAYCLRDEFEMFMGKFHSI